MQNVLNLVTSCALVYSASCCSENSADFDDPCLHLPRIKITLINSLEAAILSCKLSGCMAVAGESAKLPTNVVPSSNVAQEDVRKDMKGWRCLKADHLEPACEGSTHENRIFRCVMVHFFSICAILLFFFFFLLRSFCAFFALEPGSPETPSEQKTPKGAGFGPIWAAKFEARTPIKVAKAPNALAGPSYSHSSSQTGCRVLCYQPVVLFPRLNINVDLSFKASRLESRVAVQDKKHMVGCGAIWGGFGLSAFSQVFT